MHKWIPLIIAKMSDPAFGSRGKARSSKHLYIKKNNLATRTEMLWLAWPHQLTRFTNFVHKSQSF